MRTPAFPVPTAAERRCLANTGRPCGEELSRVSEDGDDKSAVFSVQFYPNYAFLN